MRNVKEQPRKQRGISSQYDGYYAESGGELDAEEIQDAIHAIEAEIEERRGLISNLRRLNLRPAAVERTDVLRAPSEARHAGRDSMPPGPRRKQPKQNGALD